MKNLTKTLFLVSVYCFFSCSNPIEEADKLWIEKNFEEAFVLYKDAAEAGNSYAMWKLSNAYNSGLGVKVDREEAKRWLMKAADMGCDEAVADLADCYISGMPPYEEDEKKAVDMYTELMKKSKNSYAVASYAYLFLSGVDNLIGKNPDKALDILNSVEDKDNEAYLSTMGWIYLTGISKLGLDYEKAIEYYTRMFEKTGKGAGIIGCSYQFGGSKFKPDLDKAISWFKKGIEFNNANCFNRLAGIYLYKDSVRAKYYNPQKGLELLEKLKEFDPGTAFDALGCYYMQGNPSGEGPEYDKAFENYEKAAEADSRNGTLNLGVMYLNGWGCEKDPHKAQTYMEKAVSLKSPDAAAMLASLYSPKGEFGYNPEKEKHYLEIASNYGNIWALIELGNKYLSGSSSLYPKDLSKAFNYIKEAADLGNKIACEYISKAYEEGLGCEKDLKRAKEYRERIK